MDTNGSGTDRARVKFGAAEHQEISADLASVILTMWRNRHPEVFGAYLAEAMTGARPKPERASKSE